MQIERLSVYWHAGKFPHNHDFADQRRPYFVDRHGTLCAMAYLINASGRHDIVQLVAATDNNATVLELAGDPVIGPALAAWLRDTGLTVEEAQRIQPEYVYVSVDEEISTGFAIGSVAAGSLNLVSAGINSSLAQTRGTRSWLSVAGLGSGLAGIALGVGNVDAGGGRKALALVDVTLGAASLLASTLALIRTHPIEPHASLTRSAGLAILPTARFDATGRPMIGVRSRF